MIRVSIPIILASAIAVGTCSAADKVVRPGQELNRAKLAQIAMLVDHTSGGKSRLLISKGVSANPRTGHVVRDADLGDMPFVTVYPVSSPVETKLGKLGEGRILGAVTMLTPATSPAGSKSQPLTNTDGYGRTPRGGILINWAVDGTYLIFYRVFQPYADTESNAADISLVAVTVDDEGHVAYKDVLRTPLLPHEEEKAKGRPEVTAAFPDKDTVSESNPAWRALIGLNWNNEPYRFQLDMEIEMV